MKGCDVYWKVKEGWPDLEGEAKKKFCEDLYAWVASYKIKKLVTATIGNITELDGFFIDGRPLMGNSREFGNAFMTELLAIYENYNLAAFKVEIDV